MSSSKYFHAGYTRRQVLATGLTLAGGLAAAACGFGSSSNSNVKGKTTVSFLPVFWLPNEIKEAQNMVHDFNAQSSDIHVQYLQSSWDYMDTQMTVSLTSGDVPDVFQYYDAGLVAWGQQGLLSDIKKLLPASVVSSVNPATLSGITSPKGEVFGMPFESETPLIYYNVQMLKDAGIEPATLDKRWTWDQLRENAARLTKRDKKIFGITTEWTSLGMMFKAGLGWQAGATPIHQSGSNYSVDPSDNGDRQAILFQQQLFADGSADLNAIGGDAFAQFLSGHAAMFVRGAWARTYMPTIKVSGSPIQWSAMPFTVGSVRNLGSGAVQTFNVPAAASNKQAAGEFLTWWSKPEQMARINKAAGQIPPGPQAVDILKSQVGQSPDWAAALGEAADLKGQPYCPGWVSMISKAWDPAMFDVFRGKLSYDDFSAKVQKQATDIVQTAAGN